jgi:hypothetical protein
MRAPTALSDGTEVDYGLGTRRGDLQGHRIFGPTGTGGGFNNVLEYYPDDDLVIVVLTNSDTPVSGLGIAGSIARAVLAIPPTPIAEHPLSEADIAGFSGRFESAEGPRYPLWRSRPHSRQICRERAVASLGISGGRRLCRWPQHNLEGVPEK